MNDICIGEGTVQNSFLSKRFVIGFLEREKERERVKYQLTISYTKLGGQFKQQNHQQKCKKLGTRCKVKSTW